MARTELATAVDVVAEVDFHSGKSAAKPLQKPIFTSKLDHSRIYRYVVVAIDLNPQAFLRSLPS